MNYATHNTVAHFGPAERPSKRRVRRFVALRLLRLAYFLYRAMILAGVIAPPAVLANWTLHALLD